MAEAPKPKPAVSAKAAGPGKPAPAWASGEKGKKPPNPLIPVLAVGLIVGGIGWAVYRIVTHVPKVEKIDRGH